MSHSYYVLKIDDDQKFLVVKASEDAWQLEGELPVRETLPCSGLTDFERWYPSGRFVASLGEIRVAARERGATLRLDGCAKYVERACGCVIRKGILHTSRSSQGTYRCQSCGGDTIDSSRREWDFTPCSVEHEDAA